MIAPNPRSYKTNKVSDSPSSPCSEKSNTESDSSTDRNKDALEMFDKYGVSRPEGWLLRQVEDDQDTFGPGAIQICHSCGEPLPTHTQCSRCGHEFCPKCTRMRSANIIETTDSRRFNRGAVSQADMSLNGSTSHKDLVDSISSPMHQNNQYRVQHLSKSSHSDHQPSTSLLRVERRMHDSESPKTKGKQHLTETHHIQASDMGPPRKGSSRRPDQSARSQPATPNKLVKQVSDPSLSLDRYRHINRHSSGLLSSAQLSSVWTKQDDTPNCICCAARRSLARQVVRKSFLPEDDPKSDHLSTSRDMQESITEQSEEDANGFGTNRLRRNTAFVLPEAVVSTHQPNSVASVASSGSPSSKANSNETATGGPRTSNFTRHMRTSIPRSLLSSPRGSGDVMSSVDHNKIQDSGASHIKKSTRSENYSSSSVGVEHGVFSSTPTGSPYRFDQLAIVSTKGSDDSNPQLRMSAFKRPSGIDKEPVSMLKTRESSCGNNPSPRTQLILQQSSASSELPSGLPQLPSTIEHQSNYQSSIEYQTEPKSTQFNKWPSLRRVESHDQMTPTRKASKVPWTRPSLLKKTDSLNSQPHNTRASNVAAWKDQLKKLDGSESGSPSKPLTPYTPSASARRSNFSKLSDLEPRRASDRMTHACLSCNESQQSAPKEIDITEPGSVSNVDCSNNEHFRSLQHRVTDESQLKPTFESHNDIQELPRLSLKQVERSLALEAARDAQQVMNGPVLEHNDDSTRFLVSQSLQDKGSREGNQNSDNSCSQTPHTCVWRSRCLGISSDVEQLKCELNSLARLDQRDEASGGLTTRHNCGDSEIKGLTIIVHMRSKDDLVINTDLRGQ